MTLGINYVQHHVLQVSREISNPIDSLTGYFAKINTQVLLISTRRAYQKPYKCWSSLLESL